MTQPWIPLVLTVHTPMFLSAAPDAPADLRPPSLRGAARYWFRALAAPVFEPGPRGTGTAPGQPWPTQAEVARARAELAHAEAEIFGAATGGPTGAGPSPVAIRVIEPVPRTSNSSPAWLRSTEPKRPGPGFRPQPQSNVRTGNGIGYLLGQGLYAPPGRDNEHPRLVRPSHLDAGSAGRIGIRIAAPRTPAQPSVDYLSDVVAVCLWAAATFGGLGARSRRGFGGFSLDGLASLSSGIENLSSQTDPRTALTRDHPYIHQLQRIVAERHRKAVPTPIEPAPLGTGGAPWPAAPTADRWHIRTGKTTGSWPQILNQAGRSLRAFRAPVDRTITTHRGENLPPHKRWVTHEYTETIVPILQRKAPQKRDAPAASFGLPLNFQEGTINLHQGNTELRRASPIWIRVHPEGGKFRALYHVFEATIGSENSGISLRIHGRTPTDMNLDEDLAYRTLGSFLDEVASG